MFYQQAERLSCGMTRQWIPIKKKNQEPATIMGESQNHCAKQKHPSAKVCVLYGSAMQSLKTSQTKLVNKG